MNFLETKLKGCYIIQPSLFEDSRGSFFEAFNENEFNEGIGEKVHFVQDNQSFSTHGVIRAIHYQTGKHAQAKLVRVLSGRVLDVAVDLRTASSTYGQHIALELSAENNKQLFIPKGFGHGFSVLSKSAVFFYKCDNFYNKASEGGIIYNDEALNIDWKIPQDQIVVSEKDTLLPSLKLAAV